MNSIYFNYNEFNKNESNISDVEISKLKNLLIKYNIDFNKIEKNQYILRNISPNKAKEFDDLNIEGLYVYENYKRFYPISNAGYNLIGRTNIDDVGIEGLEYSLNSKLKSINGNRKIMKSLKGQVVDSEITLNPLKGIDIKLTIDSDYQSNIYKLLEQQVKNSNAKGGAVVVLDAKTGEILSMVSTPSINPNSASPKNYKKPIDPTYQSIFDPGSIMKPLVIAKAIDDKKVNENTTFNTQPYKVGNKLIVDDHPMDKMNVSQIIQYSSDIGTSKIALMYSPFGLYNYQSLGFGKKTGINLYGETSGILNKYNKWTQVDQALMSYGYGISITLLQIASSYTIFTNNGCYLKPKLFIESNNSYYCNPIITPKTSKTMRDILKATVVDGTGKKAGSSDFSVAGKTGTAQKLINGKYVNNAHVSSFVGFAPVENPKYIVAVMIDEPKNGYYAATTAAAPLFQKVITFLMNNQ